MISKLKESLYKKHMWDSGHLIKMYKHALVVIQPFSSCNVNQCVYPADQHLLQWWPAPVWSRFGGLPARRGAPGGNTRAVLHCHLPGSHCFDGISHFHHLLSSNGTVSADRPATGRWKAFAYAFAFVHKVGLNERTSLKGSLVTRSTNIIIKFQTFSHRFWECSSVMFASNLHYY